ncbi:MAG: cholesterol oxidase [Candidatus Hydrogenedentota bacterium]|nr:MAG: cholesterol oxidase [Candidatus Hydrogenedentota bacterium]
MEYDYDYVVVGTGFGGSVSALRLAEKGYSVGMLEMGKRWTPKDLPKTNMNLRKFLWMPEFRFFGVQQLTLLKHVFIAHGAGVGGGSLIYANTLLVPPDPVFDDARWPTDEDWIAKLAPHYDMAKKMLGAVEAKEINQTDEWLREIVDEDLNGGKATFRRHTVSVYYGEKEGEVSPDPYFNGEGPDRRACIQCAECMSLCKHGSKNSLDKNYLYLAENRGVEIIPETRVTRIVPLEEGGYEIHTEGSTPGRRGEKKVYRAKGLVLSAGVLGTVKLLLRCKAQGDLPDLSPELGNYVRTNAEAFGGVTAKDRNANYAHGVSIQAGVYTPDGTHIEAVRWGEKHDFMGLLITVMTGGGGSLPRWIRYLGTIVRHPINFLRLLWPFGWGKRSVLLMGMKPSKSYLKLRFKSTSSGGKLESELIGKNDIHAYMPVINEVTQKLAKKMDGIPGTGTLEAIMNTATTAHILGGATMGQNPETGVCDATGEVFGYPNMFICDGSLVPANLTVNPSLTITALSEYVMSHIPVKEGAKQRPVVLSSTAD